MTTQTGANVSVEETGPDGDDDPEHVGDLAGVDEETATTLADADVEAVDLQDKRVSYRDLVDAGLDADVATALRREHSLPYTSTLGGDLSERSDSVGNLQGNERAWIAASDGEWENAEYEPVFDEREEVDVWTDMERPTPVTAIAGVGDADAEKLAEAGITSVKQLTWAEAGVIADALDMDVVAIRTWRFAARGDF
jgi:predicted flap endonuclease-1-like 5' DNA nuclease